MGTLLPFSGKYTQPRELRLRDILAHAEKMLYEAEAQLANTGVEDGAPLDRAGQRLYAKVCKLRDDLHTIRQTLNNLPREY